MKFAVLLNSVALVIVMLIMIAIMTAIISTVVCVGRHVMVTIACTQAASSTSTAGRAMLKLSLVAIAAAIAESVPQLAVLVGSSVGP